MKSWGKVLIIFNWKSSWLQLTAGSWILLYIPHPCFSYFSNFKFLNHCCPHSVDQPNFLFFCIKAYWQSLQTAPQRIKLSTFPIVLYTSIKTKPGSTLPYHHHSHFFHFFFLVLEKMVRLYVKMVSSYTLNSGEHNKTVLTILFSYFNQFLLLLLIIALTTLRHSF